jgi:hypothetical protein
MCICLLSENDCTRPEDALGDPYNCYFLYSSNNDSVDKGVCKEIGDIECSDMLREIECIYPNIDGECLWVYDNEEENTGFCYRYDEIECGSILTHLQCEKVNLLEMNGCIWFDNACFLMSDCEPRNPLENPAVGSNVCGDGCVKDADGVCKSMCANVDHYVVNDLGECVIKSCVNRTENHTFSHPCGVGCYVGEWAEGNECIETCHNPFHYEPDEQNICVEKHCSSRHVSENSNKKCGSGECFYLENSVEGDSCHDICPKFFFFFFLFIFITL